MRRIYRVDPIQEALCEVRFRRPTKGWPLIPGQLFEHLRAEFPSEPEHEGRQRALRFGAPEGPKAEIMLSQGSPGVRLQSEDGLRRLRISEGALSVHVLAPYPQWPAFSELIRSVLAAFELVASDEVDVERVGLRYINRVVGPKHASEISEYFAVAPLSFPGIEVQLENFLGRTEHQVGDDPNRKLIATFASTQGDDGEPAFVLDLDVIAHGLSGAVNTSVVMDVVEELRATEREVFEASIKDSARTAFGGYEEVPLQ